MQQIKYFLPGEKMYSHNYQVKKHTIYGLSAHFLLNGFIPACLKMFLFVIYTLTELSLHFKHPSYRNMARFKEQNAWSQYGETYHRRCFSKQLLLQFSKFCSAKRRLKVVLLYDK